MWKLRWTEKEVKTRRKAEVVEKVGTTKNWRFWGSLKKPTNI